MSWRDGCLGSVTDHEKTIRRALAEQAPHAAAALLISHAASLVFEANRILSTAGIRLEMGDDDGDKVDSERLLALRDQGQAIEVALDRFECRLMRSPSVDDVVDELVERFRYFDGEHPNFRQAIDVIAEFLAEELGEDWALSGPLAVLCPDGGDSWAFSVLAFDTTSYCKPDGAGFEIEWLGSTWEPGCECGEASDDGDVLGADDQHREGCPARR